jgi:hypothetical protein
VATDDLDYDKFARSVIDALEIVGIEYMVGGALGVSAWATGRTTNDLDLVVHLREEHLVPLYEELLKRGMMVPPDIMLDLIIDDRSDLAINAIHGFSGYKAELFPLRKGDELRASALQRKQWITFDTIGEAYVHSPEDLILYKVWYYSISHQPKHMYDIHNLLVEVEDLDFNYIEHWVSKKGWGDSWNKIRSSAPPSLI